ncbi:MAG: DUF3048 domain-containing protein [Clostridiales bacterium]|jgi:hypothetical protein|nr:DUF3048 domain-containing protein [Clostridiales bacterium]
MIFIKRRISILVLALLLAGCGKKPEPAQETLAGNVVVQTELPAEPEPAPPSHEGEAVDSLTGLYIKEEAARRRPVAVVINNIRKALPQSGISQADLYYEVLAEGGITRIIAVFRDFDSKKIGPVRSARDYFVDFALDHDAVFVHHGGSGTGYAFIKSQGIDHLDGMRDGEAYWRDPARASVSGMYEHSSYTNAEKILAEIGKKEYRTEPKREDSPFDFYDGFSFPADGKFSGKITVPFSSEQRSVFEYDGKSQVYRRFYGENPQIDEETGKQLEVSNVIIQQTQMWIIKGDEAGRRQVSLVGEGKGYLATGGEYTEITWKKVSHESPTQFFDADGNKLKLNKGKTWICVFDSSGDVLFE